MSYDEGTAFLGNWEFKKGCESKELYQGNLKIEKSGETYKCIWKADGGNTQKEYLGIGILVDNQLFVARFPIQTPGGGIGLYRPIGDLRSNSALWASTKDFNVLSSGIALREDSSESFDGSYKVRYFVKGTEINNFNLNITKKEHNELYSLTWAIEDKVVLHGIGMINNGEMALAWGGIEFECEVIILSMENENALRGKCALLSNNSITEEIYTKY